MRKINKKKHLEIAISSIPSHPHPKVDFEQYATPSSIASDLLWNAYCLGDVENKSIIDLGCGCGIFAISSILLGASNVIGVDIDDEAIEVASSYSEGLDNISFITSDIFNLDLNYDVDTVFQNPPFGSQKYADRGIDLDFLQTAMDLNPSVIYSFHMASTLDFLTSYYKDLGLTITHGFNYKFPIPKLFEFHSKELKEVNVVVLRSYIG